MTLLVTCGPDLTFALLVIFNLGKWMNNELAWTLNTDNMGGPRSWTQAWHAPKE